MNYAIVAYPLSAGYRDRFEAAIRDRPTYLLVQELRRLPLLQSLRALLAVRGHVCYMPLEDPGSEALSPILGLLAAIGGASALVVVRHDLTTRSLSKRSAVRSALGVVAASVRGVKAAAGAMRELARLESVPREHVEPKPGPRVTYLNSNLWFGVKAGGSVGHVAGVVNALGRAGLAVTLWSAAPPVMIDPPARTLQLQLLSTFGVPLELNYYAFQRTMVKQLRRDVAPDSAFLYQRMSVGNYAGVVLSRKLHVPLVLEYNGSEVWVARKWGRPLRFERLAARAGAVSLRHAHLVVTVSKVLRDEVVAHGIPPERVVWYPNGIDAAIFDPARFSDEQRLATRAAHGLTPGDVVVSFVGTFGRWHGAEVFARSIRSLVDEYRDWLDERRVRFWFIGDGLQMPEVRHELGDAASGRFVRFAGLVPQASAPLYLAASDVVVAPHVPNTDGSPFFGSPTKLFEYMAMGKAILASDLGQIGEVIRPALSAAHPPSAAPGADASELGMVTIPGNAAEIASGLRFLVDSPEWRSRLGANARRVALDRYTWDRHVAVVLDRLTSLGHQAVNG